MKKDKSNDGGRVGIEVEMDEKTAQFFNGLPQGIQDYVMNKLGEAFMRAHTEHPGTDWAKIIENGDFTLVADDTEDAEDALGEMASWDLCEEADQSCSFIMSVLDVLDVSSGKDLIEGTVSALTFKCEQEVDRLQRIIDIMRKRTRELEKAA